MNKKLIAGGMALTLCLTAIAPVYKSLSFNREILEPTKLQQAETQVPEKNYPITESETLKAEDLAIQAIAAANIGSAVTTASIASKAAKDDTSEKSASSATPEKTTTTVKNTTSSSAAKKATGTTSTKSATRSGSATSRGTTSTVKSTTSTKKSTTSTVKSTTSAKTTSTNAAKTTASTQNTGSKASAVIATAKNYMGVPYVWGGVSPSGFDCSGFTQFVLKENGISIPRVTSDQYGAGVAVSKSNLRVGDLVFFTTYKAGPSHVGFYMGDGKFIHSSSSKGVTISSLDSSYYSSRYIGARRVL